ncbi:MAG: AAA family ATPase [Desulfuromonadaceae bacterium]
MIISFSVENWRSFREQSTLSMVAGREKQHSDRLPDIPGYGMKLLPVAAIYGGNASGKTNLFTALNFVRHLIVAGTLPGSLIPTEPYRLDPECASLPSRFRFELLISDKCYEFSCALTQQRVIEEKLVEILKTTEKVLYTRTGDAIEFHSTLKRDKFLGFAFKGTRDNQLFLTNSVNQKVETFKPVYDWFKNNLTLIAPDTRFEPFEQFLQEDHPLYTTMNNMLPLLDTGIEYIGGEELAFEHIPLPEPLKLKLKTELQEGVSVRWLTEPINERFVVTRQGGELKAKKLVSYHRDVNGQNIKFDMQQESDGTQRTIDLLPAFLEMAAPGTAKVFVIDELDRSLHTLLTRRLLEGYLFACGPECRSQLLFTTHDVLLMDQDLLRRDEMWVAERDRTGSSTLISFSEYKDVRNDKDIRKSYLQGRLGGVPRILMGTLRSTVEKHSEGEAA